MFRRVPEPEDEMRTRHYPDARGQHQWRGVRQGRSRWLAMHVIVHAMLELRTVNDAKKKKARKARRQKKQKKGKGKDESEEKERNRSKEKENKKNQANQNKVTKRDEKKPTKSRRRCKRNGQNRGKMDPSRSKSSLTRRKHDWVLHGIN
jgi:hypothetical protein